MINLNNIVEIDVFGERKSSKAKYFKNYKLFGFIPIKSGVYWVTDTGRPILSFGCEKIEDFVKDNFGIFVKDGEIWEKAKIEMCDTNDNEFTFYYPSDNVANKYFNNALIGINDNHIKFFDFDYVEN